MLPGPVLGSLFRQRLLAGEDRHIDLERLAQALKRVLSDPRGLAALKARNGLLVHARSPGQGRLGPVLLLPEAEEDRGDDVCHRRAFSLGSICVHTTNYTIHIMPEYPN